MHIHTCNILKKMTHTQGQTDCIFIYLYIHTCIYTLIPLTIIRSNVSIVYPLSHTSVMFVSLNQYFFHGSVVHVACTTKGGIFSGDQVNRQTVDMRFGSLVDMLANPSHPLLSENEPLDFYLCQCPIISHDTAVPAQLPEMSFQFILPKIIPESSLLQVCSYQGHLPQLHSLHTFFNYNLNIELGVNY